MNEGPWPQRGRASPSEQKAFILKQAEESTPVADVRGWGRHLPCVSSAGWLISAGVESALRFTLLARS